MLEKENRPALAGADRAGVSQADCAVDTRESLINQASSWRDRIGIHPAANLPAMSNAELIELGKDIDENGLQQPIILYCEKARRGRHGLQPDGEVVVLDGVNRLTAMEKVGIELFTEYGHLGPEIDCSSNGGDPVKLVYGRWPIDRDEWRDDVEPYSYVASANVHRRHLDRQQKREVIESCSRQNRSDRTAPRRNSPRSATRPLPQFGRSWRRLRKFRSWKRRREPTARSDLLAGWGRMLVN
jgi:hypothetical protein